MQITTKKKFAWQIKKRVPNKSFSSPEEVSEQTNYCCTSNSILLFFPALRLTCEARKDIALFISTKELKGICHFKTYLISAVTSLVPPVTSSSRKVAKASYPMMHKTILSKRTTIQFTFCERKVLQSCSISLAKSTRLLWSKLFKVPDHSYVQLNSIRELIYSAYCGKYTETRTSTATMREKKVLYKITLKLKHL